MQDDQAVQGARKPYHAPVIDDLGSLREVTAGGGGGANQDGPNTYAPDTPAPSS